MLHTHNHRHTHTHTQVLFKFNDTLTSILLGSTRNRKRMNFPKPQTKQATWPALDQLINS